MNTKTKLCRKCGERKPESEFYSDRAQCKDCMKAKRKKLTPEQSKKKRDAFMARNPNYYKEYYKNNKKTIDANSRRFVEFNPERSREISRVSRKKYYWNNREKVLQMRKEYRAKVKAEELEKWNSLSEEERQAILTRQREELEAKKQRARDNANARNHARWANMSREDKDKYNADRREEWAARTPEEIALRKQKDRDYYYRVTKPKMEKAKNA